MKLNSLIKYNSLKIFSLLGYLLLVAIIYFQFIALPAAAKIDKTVNCHFDANFPMCAGNDVEIISFIVYFAIAFLCLLSLAFVFFEFLWKKYKSKNNTEKNYSKFSIVLFWIGASIATVPFWLFIWFAFISK